MYEKRIISLDTLWKEASRRNKLGPNFDAEQELADLLFEAEEEDGEAIDALPPGEDDDNDDTEGNNKDVEPKVNPLRAMIDALKG